MNTRIPLGLAALALAAPAVAATEARAQAPVRLEQVWELSEGLDRPESVIYDAKRDVLYVSNIVGESGGKDGVGYLSRVSTDGRMLTPQWVTGLHAPKGLAIHGDRLYVADIDQLVAVDLNTGRIARRWAAAGAQFLNDVTATATGDVIVSDSRTGALYRLRSGRLTPWLEHEHVKAPNGVEVVVLAGDPSVTVLDPQTHAAEVCAGQILQRLSKRIDGRHGVARCGLQLDRNDLPTGSGVDRMGEGQRTAHVVDGSSPALFVP